MNTKFTDRIFWIGQATIKIISGGKTIFFDPFKITSQEKADIVFITHSHHDHLSLPDLKKVCREQTVVVAPRDCENQLADSGLHHIEYVEPGMEGWIGELKYITIPAYNIVKTNFHPRSNNWVGYVVDIEGTKVYHAGDTERIPEMQQIHCDIAMLPLGQTYTMNSVEEAANAALDTGCSIAIPIHYGMYEGTFSDAEKFRQLLQDKIEVVIK